MLASGVALSATQGTPDELPALSLEWGLLLHMERAALLIATTCAVLLIGFRALNGRFPMRLGQIEYSTGGREQELDTVYHLQEERLRAVETQLGMWSASSKPSEGNQQI